MQKRKGAKLIGIVAAAAAVAIFMAACGDGANGGGGGTPQRNDNIRNQFHANSGPGQNVTGQDMWFPLVGTWNRGPGNVIQFNANYSGHLGTNPRVDFLWSATGQRREESWVEDGTTHTEMYHWGTVTIRGTHEAREFSFTMNWGNWAERGIPQFSQIRGSGSPAVHAMLAGMGISVLPPGQDPQPPTAEPPAPTVSGLTGAIGGVAITSPHALNAGGGGTGNPVPVVLTFAGLPQGVLAADLQWELQVGGNPGPDGAMTGAGITRTVTIPNRANDAANILWLVTVTNNGVAFNPPVEFRINVTATATPPNLTAEFGGDPITSPYQLNVGTGGTGGDATVNLTADDLGAVDSDNLTWTVTNNGVTSNAALGAGGSAAERVLTIPGRADDAATQIWVVTVLNGTEAFDPPVTFTINVVALGPTPGATLASGVGEPDTGAVIDTAGGATMINLTATPNATFTADADLDVAGFTWTLVTGGVAGVQIGGAAPLTIIGAGPIVLTIPVDSGPSSPDGVDPPGATVTVTLAHPGIQGWSQTFSVIVHQDD
jgi:hypothetical protein